MSIITLRTHTDRRVLFEGAFRSVRGCLETAVAQGVPLADIDLARANLANSSLDGAHMPGARLRGSNLTGANLSEACLTGADLSGASLYNACLAWSACAGSDFRYAFFGATDIAGADLSGCRFAGLSAFSLPFADASSLAGADYEVPGRTSIPMHRPPLVLLGLSYPVACLDTALLIGNELFPVAGEPPDAPLGKRALLHTCRSLLPLRPQG